MPHREAVAQSFVDFAVVTLIYWGFNKMSDILHKFFYVRFHDLFYYHHDHYQTSTEVCSKVSHWQYHKSALAEVMAWCQTGTKPLPKPMLTQAVDKYTHHLASWFNQFELSQEITGFITHKDIALMAPILCLMEGKMA